MSSLEQPRNVPRQDVLTRFHLSPSGLHKLVKEERFPPPFYVGAKPLWPEVDLKAVEAGHWTPAMRAHADQVAALAESPAANAASRIAESPAVLAASRVAEAVTAPRRGRRAAR